MYQSIIFIDPRGEWSASQGVDRLVVTPVDNKEIGIKQVRELQAWVNRTAFSGGHKYVVVEQAHRLSRDAQHALLKTLEEPPAGTSILLLVNRAEALLETIRSRCALVDGRRDHAYRQAETGDGSSNIQGFGLEKRVRENVTATMMSFAEFCGLPELERWKAADEIIKQKGKLVEVLVTWQQEMIEQLHRAKGSEAISLVQALELLDEANTAIRRNVLPRLVMDRLLLALSTF